MSYVGSAPAPSQVQFSTLDAQSFNGDGSTLTFTLNRAVSLAASIEVTVNNVQQSPYDGSYTVNGTTTLTFSEAPSAGTSNIYVRFLDYPLASITPGDGTVGLDQLSATGTPSSSTYLRGDNTWASVASSQWTTSGSNIYYTTGNVGIGTSNTPSNKDTVTPKFVVNGAGVAGSMQVVRNTTVGAGGGIIEVSSTRGSDVNSYTILQSGDGVGSITFSGADGTQFTPAAGIQVQVDGTPGANDMPGRLVFTTTADGASSPTERMRIDSSGNVGIGATTSLQKLTVAGSAPGSAIGLEIRNTNGVATASNTAALYLSATGGVGNGSSIKAIFTGTPAANHAQDISFNAVNGGSTPFEAMRLTNAGNLQFNSGYGSVATAYGCRAWATINGTGTPAVTASGNVSSVTDLGTGYYQVNFTTSLPDANYATVAGVQKENTDNDGNAYVQPGGYSSAPQAAGYTYLKCIRLGYSSFDPTQVYVACFR